MASSRSIWASAAACSLSRCAFSATRCLVMSEPVPRYPRKAPSSANKGMPLTRSQAGSTPSPVRRYSKFRKGLCSCKSFR